jgi:hypothetical protein
MPELLRLDGSTWRRPIRSRGPAQLAERLAIWWVGSTLRKETAPGDRAPALAIRSTRAQC